MRETTGVKILKFADERYAEERREVDKRYAEERREADKRYAEREQKAREESHRQGVEQERERVAESLRSRGFDESTIEEVLSFKPKDDGDIEEGHSAQQA